MAIKTDVVVPFENVTDDSIVVAEIMFKTGSHIEKGDILCRIETSKSVVDVESPESGYVELMCSENDEIKPGGVLAVITEAVPRSITPKQPETAAENTAKTAGLTTLYSNSASRMMTEHGLLSDVFNGRAFVKESDVSAYLGKKTPEKIKSYSGYDDSRVDAIPPVNTTLKRIPRWKAAEVAALSSSQNLLITNLAAKVTLPPSFAHTGKAPFGSLLSSLTPLILKLTCETLQIFPEFNSFFHNGNIYTYDLINIGYTIDLGSGLRVVSLGNLHGTSPDEINKLIFSATKKYLKNALKPEEITGSTFTVTDLSSEGVESFTPLINRYQSASLGISSVDERSLSFILNIVFDHRVHEGRSAARFVSRLRKEIQKCLETQSPIVQA
ncbi:MAG: 2-oxo acid dehydrogenase subunit E2 [Nitrospirae bacterium YQR-1]